MSPISNFQPEQRETEPSFEVFPNQGSPGGQTFVYDEDRHSHERQTTLSPESHEIADMSAKIADLGRQIQNDVLARVAELNGNVLEPATETNGDNHALAA